MPDKPNFRLKRLHGQVGDVVYQLTKVQFSNSPAPEKFSPPMNAYRCPNGFAICIDLAGVNKSEIDVQVQSRLVRVRGRREAPEPKEKDGHPVQVLSMEIDSGPFEREIKLNVDVEVEEVRAEYKDGLLWIYIPYRSEG